MEDVLSDVVVIDLSRVLPGQYCTMILGDLGATVIKVEQPGRGGDTRYFGPPFIAGESGLMGVTGALAGESQRVGSPVGDVSAGMYASMSVVAALRVRDRSGKGQYIDISLVETSMSMLGNVASNYLISGEEAPRLG